MGYSDITKLRRARRRVTRQLAKLEPMVEGYRAKLAQIEARILESTPELTVAAPALSAAAILRPA